MTMTNNNMPHDDDSAIFDRIPKEVRFLFLRVPVLSLETRVNYMKIVEDVAHTIDPEDILYRFQS